MSSPDTSHAYPSVSYWLETAGDLTPRPPLDGSCDADVAILGAGYTGLWTAYELLRLEPSLRVVIVERDIAGYGASGRNGGWCTAETGASLSLLTRRFGREQARAVHLAMCAVVDDIGRITTEEHIDCDFRKGGMLAVARGRGQLESLRATAREYADAGFAGRVELLDRSALQQRVRVHGAEAALFSPDCAVVHPGRLVRGLARVVESRGARIVERTEVVSWTSGRRPAFHTPRGDIRAKTLVLAGEAFLSRLRPLRRDLLPIYSLIVLSEPLGDAQWAATGWSQHECMASMRLTVDYLSRTPDRRIVVGGRGAPYHFGSRLSETSARHAPTQRALRTMLADWFPQLGTVQFTHAWGGAVGIPRDFLPRVNHDPASGIAAAYGYTGNGVAFARLAGATLAELITERSSERTALPFVGLQRRRWEPEPLRWLGVRAVQAALSRTDARRSRRNAAGRRGIAERLVAH